MAGSLTPPALYIHVPFCQAKCPYCAFYSVPASPQLVSRYLAALAIELDRYHQWLPARTLYMGGGSPSILEPDPLKQLLDLASSYYTPQSEWTVEVNPHQVTPAQLDLLKTAGVNRLSIGVQAFQDRWLQCLGRPYNAQTIYQTIAHARTAGFTNISIDLIFALPAMTLPDWKDQLEQAIETGVEHISAYSLTWEPDTSFARQASLGRLTPASDDLDRAMYEWTMTRLPQAGYLQYEISNFARSGFECRHNSVYWLNDPWIGVGPAAGSWIQGRRTENLSDLARYCQTVESGQWAWSQSSQPRGESLARETAVLMLRTSLGLDYRSFQQRTGYDARQLFDKVITHYARMDLIDADPKGFRLTPSGRCIADSILCDLID